MMEDCSMHLQVFQPTLPRGERRRRCCSFQKRTTISTHAPARGATPQLLSRCPENGYFNPRSREGSDLAYRNPSNAFKISTHAPARGATAPLKTTNLSIPISTHAPARGATMARSSGLLAAERFQPTLPRGERHMWKKLLRIRQLKFQPTLPRGERRNCKYQPLTVFPISTHAPARGATNVKPRHPNRQWNFNPRSREGSDTPYQAVKGCFPYFNPRSREGSDNKPSGIRS